MANKCHGKWSDKEHLQTCCTIRYSPQDHLTCSLQRTFHSVGFYSPCLSLTGSSFVMQSGVFFFGLWKLRHFSGDQFLHSTFYKTSALLDLASCTGFADCGQSMSRNFQMVVDEVEQSSVYNRIPKLQVHTSSAATNLMECVLRRLHSSQIQR